MKDWQTWRAILERTQRALGREPGLRILRSVLRTIICFTVFWLSVDSTLFDISWPWPQIAASLLSQAISCGCRSRKS
jgi:hypothetical protein